MNTEIQEGNKLIAEFMGMYVAPFNGSYQYHSSWDWLMPVVQKIKATDTGLDVYSLYVEDSLRTANIKEVYEAVIDFIKNYNEKIKKPHELS